MSFMTQMGNYFGDVWDGAKDFASDVGTAVFGSEGDDEAADEIRSQDTVEDHYNKQVAAYESAFGKPPSADQQAAFRKKAEGMAPHADPKARDAKALEAQEAKDPLIKISGGSVAPGKASSSLIGPGSTNFSSAGPTDLLKQQIGVGFVNIDPMAFLRTFK